MRQTAPLVLFTYNRPEHTRAVLDSLNDNTLAYATDLHIFSDGPKDKTAEKQVEEVRKLLKQFASDCAFRSVTIHESKENLGCMKSVKDGVSEILSSHDRVIVLEDDLVCRKNMLEYMNDALDLYKDNPQVWSISAHTRDFPELKNYKQDTYFTYRACSSGWGAWKDRWDSIDWEVTDWPALKHDRVKRARLARGGTDLYHLLELEMEQGMSGWDIREQYAMSKTDMMTVYPRVSFTYNIGIDGSGIHEVIRTNEEYEDLEAVPYHLPKEVRFDKKMNKAFLHAEYPTLWEKAVRKVKRLVKR